MVWADVLAENSIAEATYVLAYAYNRPSDGQRFLYQLCTTFAAYYTGAVWTNAHCVDGMIEIFEELRNVRGANLKFWIVQSGASLGNSETSFEIPGEYWKHPDYDDTTTRSEDIALLDVDGTLPVLFELLPRRFADALRVGQPVGTLGFPGEAGIAGGAESNSRVTPTFKDGVVGALRIINSGESPHVQVQYNLDTSGGASGSPVFDHEGWLVAIHNASSRDAGDRGINYGIRVDAIWEFLDVLESGRAGMPPPPTAREPRAYSHTDYQPFPENWNGETIAP